MFPNDEMLGFCSSCGVKIIRLGRRPQFLENYREHYFSLSNDTLMKVGVCDVCRVELVSGDAGKMAKKILQNHKLYWATRTKKIKKTNGKVSKDIPRFFEKLEVENPNTNPRDFTRYLEKKRKEKQELKAMSAAESVAYHSR